MPARDCEEHACADDPADHLRNHIRHNLAGWKSPTGEQADRHRRIDMASADMTDRVRHREQRQTKSERNTDQPDPNVWRCRGDHRRATSAEHQKGPMNSAAIRFDKLMIFLSG